MGGREGTIGKWTMGGLWGDEAGKEIGSGERGKRFARSR
jgi:hypothetical protein